MEQSNVFRTVCQSSLGALLQPNRITLTIIRVSDEHWTWKPITYHDR